MIIIAFEVSVPEYVNLVIRHGENMNEQLTREFLDASQAINLFIN